MRFSPPAAALSLALALTASVAWSAPPPVTARAQALVNEGRAALAAGQADNAVDAFEAALTLQPGHPAILVALAEATRKQGMQGKALHYYREVLAGDPQNLSAIAGEGQALVEKGAVEKAKRNLTKLQGLCGNSCGEAQALAAAIARGPAERVVTAEAVTPKPVANPN